MLANVVLHRHFDTLFALAQPDVVALRYADDILLLGRSGRAVEVCSAAPRLRHSKDC